MANFGLNSIPTTAKTYANGMITLSNNAYKKGKDAMAGLVKRMSTDKEQDRVASAYATGTPSVWNDGELRTQGQIKEGYNQYFVQVPFGLEFGIGRIFEKFQANGMRANRMNMNKLGTEFFLIEQLSEASLYSYGFADTNTYLSGITGKTVSALLPDGKRVFSVAHRTSPDNATTWSNALGDQEPVGEEGLDALLLNLHNQVDSDGKQLFLGQNGVTWAVPREQWAVAMRTVHGELRSGTADNDIRVFNNMKVADGYYNGTNIKVVLVPWFSSVSTTAHFAIANEAINQYENVLRLTSIPFKTDTNYDGRTKTVYVGAEEMFTVGVVDARGLAGSTGLDVAGGYTS